MGERACRFWACFARRGLFWACFSPATDDENCDATEGANYKSLQAEVMYRTFGVHVHVHVHVDVDVHVHAYVHNRPGAQASMALERIV